MPNWFLAGTAVPFSPADISGLKLWLDATQITGLSDNDAVTTWEDSSSSGFDATEATNTPLYKTNIQNGKPCVRFDGSNDKLKVTPGGSGLVEIVASAAKSIFVVAKVVAIGSNSDNSNLTVYDNRAIFSSTGNSSISLSMQSTGPYVWYQQYPEQTAVSVATGTTYIFEIRHESGTVGLRVNGGTEATTSDAGSLGDTALYIGTSYDASKPLQVDIMEMLFYNVAVGSTDMTVLRDYLNTKWAVY